MEMELILDVWEKYKLQPDLFKLLKAGISVATVRLP